MPDVQFKLRRTWCTRALSVNLWVSAAPCNQSWQSNLNRRSACWGLPKFLLWMSCRLLSIIYFNSALTTELWERRCDITERSRRSLSERKRYLVSWTFINVFQRQIQVLAILNWLECYQCVIFWPYKKKIVVCASEPKFKLVSLTAAAAFHSLNLQTHSSEHR